MYIAVFVYVYINICCSVYQQYLLFGVPELVDNS